MSDDELKRALKVVAGPLIRELSERGYEISVVRLTLHSSDARVSANMTQRLSPRMAHSGRGALTLTDD